MTLPDSGDVGILSFSDVRFHYPTRKDVEVLRGLTFQVGVNQRVAIVGTSGCGKSTVIQMIQRFYDAHSGSVSFWSANLKSINL